MIRLYGSPITRAQRTMWMLDELGVPYEQIPAVVPSQLPPGTLAPVEELQRLNPAGKVPILVDGEVVLTESFAINLYLAKKYESALSPRSDGEWGLALQWTTWIATEIESDLTLVTVVRRQGLLDSLNDEQRQLDALRLFGLQARLGVLDQRISETQWLGGDRFSVADLNAAAALALARPSGVDFGPLPHARKWLDECLARSAARSTWGKVIADARALGFVGDLDVPPAA